MYLITVGLVVYLVCTLISFVMPVDIFDAVVFLSGIVIFRYVKLAIACRTIALITVMQAVIIAFDYEIPRISDSIILLWLSCVISQVIAKRTLTEKILRMILIMTDSPIILRAYYRLPRVNVRKTGFYGVNDLGTAVWLKRPKIANMLAEDGWIEVRSLPDGSTLTKCATSLSIHAGKR